MPEELDDTVRRLFDLDVVARCADCFADLDDLLPEERGAVEKAIPKRRREFATGRALARDLLDGLGLPRAAIPPGPSREPMWPPGVIGSISHAAGMCVAVLARRRPGDSLGIDIESIKPLRPRILEMICTASERARIAALPPPERDARAMTLFCIKEAVYKCQFPLTGTFLGFQGAEVEIDAEQGRFEAAILADDVRRVLPAIRGRFTMLGTVVIAGAFVIGDRRA